jgi:hypothetical protein
MAVFDFHVAGSQARTWQTIHQSCDFPLPVVHAFSCSRSPDREQERERRREREREKWQLSRDERREQASRRRSRSRSRSRGRAQEDRHGREEYRRCAGGRSTAWVVEGHAMPVWRECGASMLAFMTHLWATIRGISLPVMNSPMWLKLKYCVVSLQTAFHGVLGG